MQFLKTAFNFYINASIHVALAVYALLRVTEIYVGLPYNESLDYFIFFGSIVAYNFVKYANVTKQNRHHLTKSLKGIYIISIVALAIQCYYAFQLSLQTLLLFIPFAILTFFYAVPFFLTTKNLRNIRTLKIIIIALVWAGVTVLIPILDAQLSVTNTVLLLFIQRFLFVIVLIIPFDIRDLKYDHTTLQTLPQRIGISNVKRLAVLLLLLILFLELQIQPTTHFLRVLLLICTLLLILVVRATKNQSKFYSAFWVEGIPILWWLLLKSTLF